MQLLTGPSVISSSFRNGQHAGHTTQEDNEDVLFEPLLNADVFIYQLCTSSAKSFFRALRRRGAFQTIHLRHVHPESEHRSPVEPTALRMPGCDG